MRLQNPVSSAKESRYLAALPFVEFAKFPANLHDLGIQVIDFSFSLQTRIAGSWGRRPNLGTIVARCLFPSWLSVVRKAGDR